MIVLNPKCLVTVNGIQLVFVFLQTSIKKHQEDQQFWDAPDQASMADSIPTIVLKSTISWLLENGGDRVEKNLTLRNGVVDQHHCESIVRELDAYDIKSDLNVISGKVPDNMKRDFEEKAQIAKEELRASIKLYSEGVRLISFEVNGLNSAEMKEQDMNVISCPSVGPEAKERFKEACEKAAIAFEETTLGPGHRILAMYFRVKATLLEKVDNPADALVSCIQFLEELHSMEVVKNSFSLELNKGSSSLLFNNKNDNTKQVIWTVRHVNRVVFNITQLVGESRQLFSWPTVAIGKEIIDPLYELRFGKTLCEHDIEDCSKKQFIDSERNLTLPTGVATSMKGMIIVADIMKAKVFDSKGDFLYSLSLPIDDNFLYDTVDVDTDREGNVYLLIWIAKDVHDQPSKKHLYEVFVFDNDGMPQNKFPLRAESRGRKLAVLERGDETELLVLEGEKGLHAMVEVYGIDGTFVCQFGERSLMDAQDIVAANNGHIYVLDKFHESQGKCVHEFSADRRLVRSFGVDPDSVAITFDRANEHIVIASSCYDPEKSVFLQNVSIYDSSNAVPDDYIDSKLLRSYNIDRVRILLGVSNTVNSEGLVVVVLAQHFVGESRGKLVIMKETTKN